MAKKQKTSYFHFVFSWVRLAVCAVLLCVLVAAYFVVPKFLYPDGDDGTRLVFHAIDVGDGDCLVTELPDSKILMIDTGVSGAYNNVKKYLDNEIFFHRTDKKTIDYFINTHPDSDHYGGVYKLFADYDVKTIYRPYFNSGSTRDDDLPTVSGMSPSEQSTFNSKAATYGKVVDAMYAETDNVFAAKAGVVIGGGDANYKIIIHSPTEDALNWNGGNALDKSTSASIANGMSPVITIEYGSTIWVLTGDATAQAEDFFMATDTARNIFNSNLTDKVVILKVAHHGSGTHYTHYDYFAPDFYDFVFGSALKENSYSVISCGDSAVYHFPHENVVNALTAKCNRILVTKDSGNIKLTAMAGGELTIKTGDTEEKITIGYYSVFAGVGVVIIVLCFFDYKGGKNAKLRNSSGRGKKIPAKK
jgi:beta-lactamase superfamily II metal-dependent hydrolase